MFKNGKGAEPASNAVFRVREDMLVEAFVWGGQSKDYQLSAFPVSQVARIQQEEDGVSKLYLRDGITIPVRLAYEELKRQIYAPDIKDGNIVDLTAVTGKPRLPENAVSFKIGEAVQGEGIFLGQWQPKDHEGNFLSKAFNVFAAPRDLSRKLKYRDALAQVGKLRGWQGHDGENYDSDQDIYAALKDGSYKGGWVIPPRELLSGMAANGPRGRRIGHIAQPDNLYDHRNSGAFRETFQTEALPYYWSSTRELSSLVWVTSFSSGENFSLEDNFMSAATAFCRPVRLVPVP